MKPASISPFEASIIVALYRDIRSVSRVAAAIGRHRVTVSTILRRKKVLRGCGRPRQASTVYPKRRKATR